MPETTPPSPRAAWLAAAFERPGANEIVAHTSLRGVAAMSVLFYHCALGVREHVADDWGGYFLHSYLFVDLFFMLSGFIITKKYGEYIVGNEQINKFYYFIQLRIIRIYPTYLLWLFASIAAAGIVGAYEGRPVRLDDAFATSLVMHMSMTQNLLGAPLFWNLPLWSIAVEFIAYLLFPFLILAWRTGPRRFLWIAGGAALATVAILSLRGTIDVISGGPSVARCLAGFTLGMVLARIAPAARLLGDFWLSVVQAVSLAAMVALVHEGFEIAAILSFVVVVFACSQNRGIGYLILRMRLFHTLGLVSFSIYLAHVPVIAFTSLVAWKALKDAPLSSAGFVVLYFTLAALCTIAAAIVSYGVFERPVQAWLRARLDARDPRRTLS